MFESAFYQEGHAFCLIGLEYGRYVTPSVARQAGLGVRWNLSHGAAFDLGCRYMLNLHQVKGHSGFSLRIRNLFRKPRRE